MERAPREPETAESPSAARRRMEDRLVAGRPPATGDLKTLWEAYQAAVVRGKVWGENRLPDDLVSDMKADHDAMVRELRHRPG